MLQYIPQRCTRCCNVVVIFYWLFSTGSGSTKKERKIDRKKKKERKKKRKKERKKERKKKEKRFKDRESKEPTMIHQIILMISILSRK